MEEIYVLRILSFLAGVIGLAVAIGVLLVPRAVVQVDKKLDTTFSTDNIEKILNQRRNLSGILMKHPKVFGAILFVISFLLVLSNILLF
jgi:hypothetical protein